MRCHRILLILALLAQPVLSALTLQDRMLEAQAGDFIVAAQDKSYTLIHVTDRRADRILIQELTAPQNTINVKPGFWKEWLAQGAPGHSSWIVYEMDTHTCSVKELYDATRKQWVPLNEGDHLLATLLKLDLSQVPDHLRRRVGPNPLPGELDRRPFWNPPLYFDGQKVSGATLKAWKGYWPMDGTELAGKAVILYLPDSGYLSFFPYWIEVAGGIARAKLRIKDSGRGLAGPTKSIPKQSST